VATAKGLEGLSKERTPLEVKVVPEFGGAITFNLSPTVIAIWSAGPMAQAFVPDVPE